MEKLIAIRFASMLLVMIAMTMVVFGVSRLSGDPRYLYMGAYSRVSWEDFEAQGREMGLDKPLVVQYGIWLANAVRGDFGESIHYHRNSLEMIIERIPATFTLSGISFVVSMLLGVPLGVLSAVKRGGLWDYLGRGFAVLGQAAPVFWIAIIFIWVFSVHLDLLPTSRRGDWTHYVLPVATLGWLPAASILRLTRSSMLEVLDSEYIKLAKAKGVGSWMVVWKHALRNSLIAPLTFAAILLAGFLTGTVVVETVFAWPGIGRLAVQAALATDYPLVTGLALIFSAIFLVANLVADVAYALIDPRIRYR